MTRQQLDRVSEPLQRAGEALNRAIPAMADYIRAMVEFAVATLSFQELKAAEQTVETLKAINEAPPRVRHLARHGKKYRTRKKNINRALRDYERSRKRDRP